MINILMISLIAVFVLEVLFRPRLDKTKDGEVLLWYNTAFSEKERDYIRFKKK